MTFFDSHSTKGEEWMPHPEAGYEKSYMVSSIGRVRSVRTGRTKSKDGVLRQSKNGAGYPLVSMPKKTFSVHRLIARAFLGPVPEGMEVNHKNGVKFDNRVENLEFVTRRQNMKHCADMGLWNPKHGEANPIAKLTEPQVKEIRALRASGMIYRKIAAMYGVTLYNIHHICTRLSWKHVP